MTVKDRSYGTFNIVNPLYFIIKKMNGYIEQHNGNKYYAITNSVNPLYLIINKMNVYTE